MFEHITDKRIDSVSIKNEEIMFLIRKLNPNNAAGSDGISGQMLLIRDSSAVLPLKISLLLITNLDFDLVIPPQINSYFL